MVLLGQVIAPGVLDSGIGGFQHTASDLPQPVVLGLITVGVIGVWLLTMYLGGRGLYWVWRQIDGYVLSVWDMILPEHPFIRFGAGVTVMLFLFVFGPMAVLTQTDLLDDGDDVEIEGNSTDDDETATPSQNETESTLTIGTDADFTALGTQTIG